MLRFFAVLVVLATVVAGVFWLQPPKADLVVYCAHDSVYSAPFLRKFTADTGITVQVRYDTEATKSLGLTELIDAERDHPRCDVFWNNEPLGTIRLARAGLLHSYRGPGYERIPSGYRDPDGLWTGFGGRLRVWIVHTPTHAADEASIRASFGGDSLQHIAFAKPLYGTTRSHLTCLWDSLGASATEAWHRDLRQRGIRVVNGNGVVKDLVAAGTCAFGLTDTDDYFLAQDAGHPVAMVPATLATGDTICVPNTVAIVRGTENLTAAKRLVDYLTSAEAEIALAQSSSRQVPLGEVDPARLPDAVREMVPLVRRGYVYRDQAGSSADCLAWLKREYVR